MEKDYPRATDRDFGTWLASIRNASGLSQTQVAKSIADQLGRPFTHSTIGHWETGDILRNYKVIPAYASAVGVTVDELLRVSLTSEGYTDWAYPGHVPLPRYGAAFAHMVRQKMREGKAR